MKHPKTLFFLLLTGMGILLLAGFQEVVDSPYTLVSKPRLNPNTCCVQDCTPADTLIAFKILDEMPSWLDTGSFAVDYELAHLAVEILEEYAPPNHPRMAPAYYYLSKAYQKFYDLNPKLLPQAIAQGEQALHVTEEIGDTNSLLYILICADLGETYLYSGATQKAYELSSKALAAKKRRPDRQDLLLAELEEDFGLACASLEMIDTSLAYLHRAYRWKASHLPPGHFLLAYSARSMSAGYFYKGEHRKSLQYMKTAYEMLASNSKKHHQTISVILGDMASVSINIGDFKQAEEYLNRAYSLETNLLGKKRTLNSAGLMYKYGQLYLTKGDYKKALLHFLEALKILEENGQEESLDAAYYYSAIGVSLRSVREFPLAEDFLKKALRIRQEKLGDECSESTICAASYYALGRLYRDIGKLEEALLLLENALAVRLKNPAQTGKDYLANNYSTLGLTLIDMKLYDRAVDSLKKCLSIQPQLDNPVLNVPLNQIGTAYLLAGRYEKAEPYLWQAIQEGIWQGDGGRLGISISYTLLGRLYFETNNFDRAIELLDSASLVLRFSSIEKLDEVPSVGHLLGALRTKARFQKQQYQRTGEANLLGQATATYQTAVSIFEHQQQSFLDSRSKLQLLNDNFSVFEGALQAHFLASPGNEAAFAISERSKSFLLRQAFLESEARQAANISDAMLKKEEALKDDITSLESQLSIEESRKAAANDSLINAFKDQIFEYKRQYYLLLERMEREYPDYYRLKFDTTVITVREVQEKLLQPGQAMVEYFVGDSSLFAFVIHPDAYRMVELTNHFALDTLVRKMREGMYRYFVEHRPVDSIYTAKNQQYAEAAFQLYQQLIAPLEPLLLEAKELIIIPDGALASLPFEALLYKQPQLPESFGEATYPYLLRRYRISYAHSATLLREMQDKEYRPLADNPLLAVAPSYQGYGLTGDTAALALLSIDVSDPANWLPPLYKSQAAAAKITSLMGSDLDTAATKNRFLEKAEQFPIVHLSMHAKANEKTGEHAFLAFQSNQPGQQYELLYARELYNLRLPAELVVLSACEAGIGELRRGEGIISLSRGFAYAGAKSLVTSLWSVREQSTNDLMQYFYQHLKQGKSKREALHQAKLDYLGDSQVNPEPFFWAGFIAIGDMSPLPNYTGGNFLRYWLGGSALIVFFLIVFFLRKKGKNRFLLHLSQNTKKAR